ncbi:hypothetical protein QJ854_gp929 [Moumouvirus goulette]|uniref:Uncharacterized protein n=1 Tax=Moumouvirus goulette TaxID=1247379 RepID=M1PFT2_9VIRU|nr:hypothetical protein QJ854_gp929 [Moumouvirus goulette]AGF84853.1 hypothetical protein glt_00044 [Moumouvirus goulette]
MSEPNLFFVGISTFGAVCGLAGAGIYIDYKKRKGCYDPSSTLAIAIIGGIIGITGAFVTTACIAVGAGLFFGTMGIYYGAKKLLLLSGIL